jgi:hypothetical protein
MAGRVAVNVATQIVGGEAGKDGRTEGKKVEPSKFGEFVDIICYNCGTLGHHKANCKKAKICFICKSESYLVDACPVKSQSRRCAQHLGSAAGGLEFYNIMVPEVEEGPVMDFTNCGLVYVETGDISMEELQLELATCFNPNWPWQIRKMEEWCYLVRFPPNKKVEDMADFNSFNLGKEGVSVSVKTWQGDLDPYAELEEVWLQVQGLPPKWCVWEIIDQLASSYGMLEDVDWQKLFNSFYEVVRMKIKYRDVTKIPRERLFCVDKKLYKITTIVEMVVDRKPEQVFVDDARLDDRNGEGKDNFDEADDLDDDEE